MGRELQKHYGQPAQCVLTMPLLEGLDGINKMSKSLGNYIGINEDPQQIFGKLMSISDGLMWRYIELLSFESLASIAKWREEVAHGRNPRDIKVLLAQEIVARFHTKQAAVDAADGIRCALQARRAAGRYARSDCRLHGQLHRHRSITQASRTGG